jgi:hypothetical protein
LAKIFTMADGLKWSATLKNVVPIDGALGFRVKLEESAVPRLRPVLVLLDLGVG